MLYIVCRFSLEKGCRIFLYVGTRQNKYPNFRQESKINARKFENKGVGRRMNVRVGIVEINWRGLRVELATEHGLQRFCEGRT